MQEEAVQERSRTSFPYQVGILGGTPAQIHALKSTVVERFTDIGLNSSDVVFLEDEGVVRREKRAPFVGVYFGRHGYDPLHMNLVDNLRLDSVVVIPVVESLDRFTDQVPPALAPVNGLELADSDPSLERVCAIVLQNFRLLRKERRIFISYRRDESTPIASQIYAALDARGFDVFLDTNGVPPGEDFQEVLWHRLADSDVVVLLDTKGFSERRWTQEELAKANTTNIQILHLLWPGSAERVDSAFSEFRRLKSEDFVDHDVNAKALLGQSTVERIVTDVEALRARAIAARYRFIVDSFCDAARLAGLDVSVQFDRKIVVDGGRNNVVVVPLVGVPNAECLHQEVMDFPESDLTPERKLWAIYDERGLLPRTLEHLDWLGYKLPISPVPVFDVVRRLGEEAS